MGYHTVKITNMCSYTTQVSLHIDTSTHRLVSNYERKLQFVKIVMNIKQNKGQNITKKCKRSTYIIPTSIKYYIEIRISQFTQTKLFTQRQNK